MAPDTDSVERLEVLLAEQSALRRVATLVAADPDPGRLFECVCRELGGVLGVESTDALRYAHDGSATIVGGWALRGSPSFPVGTSVPVEGETVAAKLYRSGRPERVDDYSDVAGELAARLRGFGIKSAVGAPVKVAGRLWGAIMAVDARPYAFPQGTEQRIANFAELVTAALANADARDQLAASRARILAAGYEERRRLERDLHDGAQQEFVSAALSLRLARREWSRDPDEGLRLLDQASDQLQAGLRDLRELAAGIHPSVLTDRGLGAALQALAARAAVPVELGALPVERLPATVETTAYFVVAEALTNASKHGRARGAEIGVRVAEDSAIVEIRDDGVGGADPSGGTGLRGLVDRVSALGGELAVESPHGRGTAITARIPLSAYAAPPIGALHPARVNAASSVAPASPDPTAPPVSRRTPPRSRC
jgi:signal transduction histidine kinase